MAKISVIINTLNEEKNLPKVLSSVKNFAGEIIVVDMKSDDKTVEIAKKAGAKVFTHERVGYVEPARNYAIGKATGNWILIIDADEIIPSALADKLKKIAYDDDSLDYYRIPRKNIIFGKWIKHTLWWPDHQLRFFKKGYVSWSDEIHSIPLTTGVGLDLVPDEASAIIHENYQTIEQFMERLNRYTTVQSKLKIQSGYQFKWIDLIKKPATEFIQRFLAGKGYKDGLHGLVLSVLQAFSEFLVVTKTWQTQNFKEENINLADFEVEIYRSQKEIFWWIYNSRYNEEQKIINKLWLKLIKHLKYQ